jgi:hypothetical protein
VEKTVSWALSEEAATNNEKVSTPFATMSEVKVVMEM